ncbi:MAG: nucleotidyl transferase AbiEii/AbiGii toxin family protein [Betaproteobacteria bacterium]|nr:nucleotidyl transferase AbiEii/AbiGii toxin family protein [Betaproteobacteria bacterium]
MAATATLSPNFAGLAPLQRQLWPELRPCVELGFVLYGGTAVSLHLGHRRSVDFVFFHDRRLVKDEIRATFAFIRRAATLQDSKDMLVVLVPGSRSGSRHGVKVSFFGGMSFGRIGHPLLCDDGVMQVASLDDLMAHKLKVILQRSEKKDYQDIAAMIRAGCPVARGLAAARLFFGNAFQPAACLKALTYFKDGDLGTLSGTDRNTLIEAAKSVRALPRIALRSKRLASA